MQVGKLILAWFIWLNFLVVLSSPAQAQYIRVYSLSTLQPIAHATIQSTSGIVNTLSRDNGKADISGMRLDDTLIIRHTAFHSERLPFSMLRRLNFEIFLVEKKIHLEETVISAEKIPESVKNLSNKIDMIPATEIAFQNPGTAADMLSYTGDVFVQKSQGGGGSPVIRGFEANKVLLVMDGIRLNNAIFRSGHLQNVISIDPASLERAEVVYGPGSLIYGSDALGGVMHFITLKPKLLDEQEKVTKVSANAFTRFGTANAEKSSHFDFNLAGKKFAARTSVSYSDFGNIKSGRNHLPDYPDFGKRNWYAGPSKGSHIDSVYLNNKNWIQRYSGYRQLNLMERLKFQPDDKIRFGLNFYYSNTSNIDRYDKLTDTKNNMPKYGDWHYGPQKWLISSFTLNYAPRNAWFDESNIIIAYQRLNEDRISRKFDKPDEIHREEDVSVLSVNFDFNKKMYHNGRIIYGGEIFSNIVASKAYRKNILNQSIAAASTRYPDGGSEMDGASLFFKYKHFFNENLVVSGGTRYSYIDLESVFTDTTFYQFPFTDVFLGSGALTGSVDMVWNPNENWKLNILLSSGFKSPNVDDFGKVFEKNGIVVVPNDHLKPEYAYNAEIGLRKSFDGFLSINSSLFYTLLTDAIVRQDFTLNGTDTVWYDGEYYPIQANVNAERAHIYGFSVNLEADISKYISFMGNINYTKGFNVSDAQPMAHIPPVYGRLSLTYTWKKFRSELFSQYNFWKKRKDYAPSSEDNLDEATIDGTPRWITLNWRNSLQINQSINVQFNAENLFDLHYRPFSSGISAAGRNFNLTFRILV